MDKVIRVIQGANGVLTCGQKVLSKLDFRPKNLVGREKEKEKEKRGESLEREPPPSLKVSRQSDRRFPTEQEMCFPAQRVSSRDRKRGVSMGAKPKHRFYHSPGPRTGPKTSLPVGKAQATG